MRDRVFSYCTYDRVRDWLACGWMVVIPNGGHRQLNHYGIVMEWRCDCKMVRPR
jgi:hypothetical protein